MSEQMIWIVTGAAGAVLFGTLVRKFARRDPARRHAMALIVTAMLYVVFAAAGGSGSRVWVELAGVGVFGGLAIVGLRLRMPWILALGWALHPLWDVALHTAGEGFLYTPIGYVPACIGFDLVLAALIALGWAGAPARLRQVAGEV
jgi:hypothetical protein